MKAYLCEGINRDGVRETKTIWAEDAQEVQIRLRHSGWTILSVQAEKSWRWRHSSWRMEEVLTFSYQMGTLLEAGLSLRDIVAMLAREPRKGRPVQRIQEAVERGMPLYAVLRETGFPTLGCALLEAGEQAGALGATFLQVQQYYEQRRQQKKQAEQAMLYPAFVGVVLLVFLGVVVFFILPTFAEVFASMGATMPGMAKQLLQIGEWIRQYPERVGIGALLGVVGMVQLWRNRAWQRAWDTWWWKHCNQKLWYAGYAYARFFSVFGLLLQAGLVLTEALRLATPVWGNQYAVAQMDMVLAQLREGIPLAEAFPKAHLGTPMVTELLRAGEASGELANMVGECARYYEKEAKRSTKRWQSLLEPMLMSVVGVVVSVLVITLMVPLFAAVTAVGDTSI